MLVWDMAITLPKVMVAIATKPITMLQSALIATNPMMKTLNRAMKPIFLEPDASIAVMVVGAPWYTSGAHMWNGTIATLKPKPATIMTIASRRTGTMPVRPATAGPTAWKLTWPVAP